MEKRLAFSESPYEPIVGFARAVRIGPHVWVAGSLAVDGEGRPIGGTAYDQAIAIFRRKVEPALHQLGASLENVVRTRMFLVDASDAAEVSRAHKETFGETFPAATMLVVTGFVGPGFLVEIEVDAFIPG